MPIYEYRCNKCTSEFEYMQRMSEAPRTVCESCGGALERLISRSSFHLKGGGWYKDLYSSPPSAAGSSSDSKADSGSSSTSKAEPPASSTAPSAAS